MHCNLRQFEIASLFWANAFSSSIFHGAVLYRVVFGVWERYIKFGEEVGQSFALPTHLAPFRKYGDGLRWKIEATFREFDYL